MVGASAINLRRKTVPCEICSQSRRGGIGRLLRLVDADDGDGVRAAQERRGVANGTCGQAAAVPRDPDALQLKRAFMRSGDEENRTTGLPPGAIS